MENSIYLGLSRQIALRANMDMVANNLANANTVGFRAQNLLFEEFVAGQDGDTIDSGADDDLSFVYNRGQYQTEAQGSLRTTGNPLDVALNGPGFFSIQGPNGDTLYTRNGQFQMDAQGTLVTSGGFPVADAGGAPVVLPQDTTEISIDEEGFIFNQNGQVGQLGIIEFENVQALEPTGNNLYSAPDGGNPATETRTVQGHLEGSNVQPVIEVTRMINTLREFQATQNLLSSENDRLRTMIQRLTGTGG